MSFYLFNKPAKFLTYQNTSRPPTPDVILHERSERSERSEVKRYQKQA